MNARYAFWVLIGVLTLGLWTMIFTTGSPLSANGNFGDEGTMLQGAVRILEGQVPHRDFYSIPPGTVYYPLAGWMAIFGSDYQSVRWFSLLSAVMLMLAWAWLGSFFGLFPAALMAIAAVLAFAFWPFVSYHWYFLIVAVCLLRFLLLPPTFRRGIIAGLLAGVAFMLLPNKALLVLMAVIPAYLLVTPSPQRQQSFRALVIGVMLPAGLSLILLTLGRMWGATWTQVVHDNLTFYPTIVGGFLTHLRSVYVKFLISVIAVLAVLLWPSFRLPPTTQRPYLLLLCAQLGLSASVLYFIEWIHIVQVSAVMVLLFVIAARHLWRFLHLRHSSTERAARAWAMAVLLMIVSVVGWWFSGLKSVAVRTGIFVSRAQQSVVMTPRGKVYLNPQWQRFDNGRQISLIQELPVLDRLLRHELANEQIFIYPYGPGYYYFYDRLNPTAYDILPSGDPPPHIMADLQAQMERSVSVIIYQRWTWTLDPLLPLPTWMRTFFPYHYAIAQGNSVIMARTPLPALAAFVVRTND